MKNRKITHKISKTHHPYTLGLDIGTHSIGFAAIDDQQKPLRAKGKTVIGVHLFQEAKSASDRKQFRASRRRLRRRKWRLGFLNRLFEPELKKRDPEFLKRVEESNLVFDDPNRQVSAGLFPEGGDADFYHQYPTIYHLRLALMTETHPFDLREIYLAIHHIVKYRGHFLSEVPASTFDISHQSFNQQFAKLNSLYQSLDHNQPFQINEANFAKLTQQLLTTKDRKLDRQRQFAKLTVTKSGHQEIDKSHKRLALTLAKAIFGYKFKLDTLVDFETDDSVDWQIQFGDPDLDEVLEALTSSLDETRQEIVTTVRALYSQLMLNEILPNTSSVSQAMVNRYQTHQTDLQLLKQACQTLPKVDAAKIQTAYADYVGRGANHKLSHDQLMAVIKRHLSNFEGTGALANRVNQDDFLPLQRTIANQVIPHQLQQQELDRIIENQGQYYPFLKALNPNRRRTDMAKYQLDELVAFRIPYYVGPLVTTEDQQKTSGAEFAWMVRRAPGEITPWNFDQKVDQPASASQFIQRNIPQDNHLLGEKVLPYESLIYQRYQVLDELNGLTINDRALTVSEKQRLYNDLFKTQKVVTVKSLQNYLQTTRQLPTAPTINGLSQSGRFNAGLTTYLDLKAILGSVVDDPAKQADLETIVMLGTIFESRPILLAKLGQFDWLTADQKSQLAAHRFEGWGRLSSKLLVGIRNQAGQTILDQLWQTNRHFREIQNDPDFATQVMTANTDFINQHGADQVLETADLSPQNKKAIRQAIKVADDVVKAIGWTPQKVALKFAKPTVPTVNRERTSANVILRLYQKLPVEVINDSLKQSLEETAARQGALSDKLYLYFTQLGRDLYTGQPISLENLANCQVTRILPPSFVFDDSLNNQVLTAASTEDSKLMTAQKAAPKMSDFWRKLRELNLISEQKYQHLLWKPDQLSVATSQRLLAQQFSEYQPMIQWVALILTERYRSTDTQIMTIKSRLAAQLRQQFQLVKLPEVNDYDYGMDAYLAAFIGDYLNQRYPSLRPYFVYGDFSSTREIAEKLRSFNFLAELSQKEPAKLVDFDTGEVIWDKPTSIQALKTVYHYKFMLVSQAVYTRQDAMFNQTIYPANQAGRRRLIPVKQNRPVDRYGGYSGNVDAYLAIVRLGGRQAAQYKVVGIPMRMVGRLKRARQKSETTYQQALTEILKPQFTKRKVKRKTGEVVETVADFEVVCDHVAYRQLIIDGQLKFMLGSTTYQYNAKQLVLSAKARQILAGDRTLMTEETDQDLIAVYDELLAKVDQYFDLYDQRHFRQSLHDGRSQFVSLPVHNSYQGRRLVNNGKVETLTAILAGLHADPTMSNLRHLGISSPFGKFQSPNGLILSENAILVYQSPSGLFERRVALRDL